MLKENDEETMGLIQVAMNWKAKGDRYFSYILVALLSAARTKQSGLFTATQIVIVSKTLLWTVRYGETNS
jgi:hypothetical protein